MSENGGMEYSAFSVICPHCRRFTAVSFAPVRCDRVADPKFFHPAIWQRGESDQWWIGVCNNCRMPLLVHNNMDEVYPAGLPSPTDDRIPDAVRQDLDEAKRCQTVGSWRACTVMARRAMQSACIEQGAGGDRLVDQVQYLAKAGVITSDLKEWADVVRWVGNDAAHPGGEDVTQEDAEAMVELAEQFFNVLYVAPAIARKHRAKLGKQQPRALMRQGQEEETQRDNVDVRSFLKR